MTGMPELIALLHSFVGLAAVLVGWAGYYTVEALGDAQTEINSDLLGIHHGEVIVGVFIGAVTFTGSIVAYLKLSAKIGLQAADAAGQELPQHRRARGLRRADGVVRHHAEHRHPHRRHRARAAARLAPGGVHRRRRHAGRRVDAEQLLGLGGGGLGLPARQQPADRHRRARRLLRCLPELHHVRGDEPLVHLGHRRRLRHRGDRRRATSTTASTTRSTPRTPPTC